MRSAASRVVSIEGFQCIGPTSWVVYIEWFHSIGPTSWVVSIEGFHSINSISSNEGRRFADLSFYLTTNHIDVAAICEAGMNLDLKQYKIDGYHPLDHDFICPAGRGLLMYLNHCYLNEGGTWRITSGNAFGLKRVSTIRKH
jgi:hypothetical protein